MRHHSFSKIQLAATALMLHEEKNATLSDKKEACVGSQVLRKQKIKGKYWILYI
jgi:hypothetical protein